MKYVVANGYSNGDDRGMVYSHGDRALAAFYERIPNLAAHRKLGGFFMPLPPSWAESGEALTPLRNKVINQ